MLTIIYNRISSILAHARIYQTAPLPTPNTHHIPTHITSVWLHTCTGTTRTHAHVACSFRSFHLSNSYAPHVIRYTQHQHFSFRTHTAVHVRCLTTMASFFATLATTTFTATMLGIGAGTFVKQLDTATQRQCSTRDWPAHQAAAHQAFCQSFMN